MSERLGKGIHQRHTPVGSEDIRNDEETEDR